MIEARRIAERGEARPTMALLRETTRELHSIAERSTYARALIDATLPRAEYARLLRVMHAIHAQLEPALDASSDARVRAIAATVPSKLPLLEHDLAVLAERRLPSWSTLDAALESLERHLGDAAAAGASLLGALYVIEGATNGGQFLAMRLAQSAEIPPEALSYYQGYGAETIARWRALGDRVNAAVHEPAEQAALVGTAKGLFTHLLRCFEELGGALERDRAQSPISASMRATS
jgi:heme oxygenase